MYVLVTGGNGFIGQYVCAALVERGHHPLVFDRHRRVRSEYDTILGDIRDRVAVKEAVARTHGVIHLAGVLGTAETVEDPLPAVDTNIIGGLNVLEALAVYPGPAVNIAVGNHWMNNPYSISKSTVERFTQMYNADRGTNVATVRALNAYGPGQELPRPWGKSAIRKIIPTFAGQVLNGQPIWVYGSGKQIMDMIHVRDVADVLVRALERGEPDMYEAGTGRKTSVVQVAREVISAAGGGRIDYLPMRAGEPEGSVVLGDPDTLAPLDIKPDDLIPLELGISETVDSYR